MLMLPNNTAVSALMRYILAPSSLAGRGLGVGFLYLITPGSAVSLTMLGFAVARPNLQFGLDYC